ncbi:MAG: acyl-CoA thioesterase, partial [Bacteroidia bacterium]|nr:acyl-CoA thioesterase [Bacteroidia bacterium]
DQMGYAYYGNYAQYFEVARVEALRSLGITYKSMEESGIALPVLEYTVKYFKPAYYDDELLIKTTIPKLPEARIYFEYDTFNQKGVLLNKASTTLVFIDIKTGKPTAAPDYVLEKMTSHY